MTLMLNMAIGQSGRKAENYIPFFFLKITSWTEVVIIMLHTYTVLYIQEISKYFTNYSSYPRGSHFVGKEVTRDKNLVPNVLPFQSQVKWSSVGGGRSCSRSPQRLLALGQLQHPSLLYPLPTCLCSLGSRVKWVTVLSGKDSRKQEPLIEISWL